MGVTRTDHQLKVDAFMRMAGQYIPDKPTDLDPDTRVFRAKLIYEEVVRELIGEGLGVRIRTVIDTNQDPDYDITEKPSTPSDETLVFTADKPFDMVKLVDGCADGPVVITGTASAAGVAMEPIQNEVDDNNLAKFGPGGYRSDGTDGNPVGKWIKPKDHKPPRIAELLAEQGYVLPEAV